MDNLQSICYVKESRHTRLKMLHDSIYMIFMKRQTTETENRSETARTWGWGRGLTTEKHQRMFSGDKFHILIVVMATQLFTFVKTRPIHLKLVNFTMCKLYLNKSA